ncbi:PREDICTED: nuclear transcription factor Y subunit A-7-like isoform X2 [Ipomoea nil]|uniref:nuclear transcription factor Y subunit A-7-like isoform X2 n=1 Tax=Ipomoea nil TaxID=35883 RepID=UPI000901D3D0|nr:PREDICTED: nuclear transcription factor Y subunit A-7-like isoform X2 [Ipomoea nil]
MVCLPSGKKQTGLFPLKQTSHREMPKGVVTKKKKRIQLHNLVLSFGLNESNSQDEQHLKHASSIPAVMSEQLGANSQMELVGHSIMLASYPYADPQYGGMFSYCSPVQSHLFGLHHARMPLPLEMEEEPVYVNAKQYNGILRRRRVRAKAELEKKAIKARRPYLHESRHQHALRRERGSGGRFLNTKKLNDMNSKTDEHTQSGATATTNSGHSSGSEHLCTNSEGQSAVKEMCRADSHGFPSVHFTESSGNEKGSFRHGHQNWSFMGNQAPHGAPPSN